MSKDRPAPPSGARARTELHAIAFLTGACVMVVEVLGTRVIAPIFGSALFSWTALLVVTLFSLAAGYYGGGVMIDRTPTRALLGKVVLGAGILLTLVPLLRSPILSMSLELGPRAGAIVSAFLLFAPTLAALGSVGPIAIRLATDSLQATGHRVGAVYAVSTAGSVVGTITTSFVLIPSLETTTILVSTAVFLAAMGAIILTAAGKKAAAAAVALPLVGLLAPSGTMPEGFTLVARSQSPFGSVQVIDLAQGVRVMRADHSLIGAHAREDGSASFSFLHVLEAIRFARPEAKTMLQIGLGIGSLPVALERYGFKADAVEIDPAVVRLAREHFGFSIEGDVFEEDARTFIQRSVRTYDFIVHDVFTGGTTPDHLLSIEVIQQIKRILQPGGVMALNFVGYAEGTKSEATHAVARTIRAAFPHVRAFRDHDPSIEKSEIENIVFFASERPLDFTIPVDAKFENEFCREIQAKFVGWETLKSVPDGPIITDDRNPLSRLQLATAEAHFEAMGKLLPKEVWLTP